MTTRLSLLIRAQDPKDSGAWKEFVGTYRPIIVGRCHALGLRESAEDMAQIVLLKLLKGLRQYDPARGSFRAWLHVMVTRTVWSYLPARQRRGRGLSSSVLAGAEARAALEKERELRRDLARELTNQLHRDLLVEVTERVRLQVNDKAWRAYQELSAGCPAEQVAAEEGMSLAAVYKAKSRVIGIFRKEIAGLARRSDREGE